jgi:hypothetical protein
MSSKGATVIKNKMSRRLDGPFLRKGFPSTGTPWPVVEKSVGISPMFQPSGIRAVPRVLFLEMAQSAMEYNMVVPLNENRD